MIPVLIAFAAAAVATPIARAIAMRTGIVNEPNPIVQTHTRPVAYLGGAAILVAVVAAAAMAIRPFPWHVIVVAALFGALGLVDDLRPFRASTKLLLQMAMAISAVALLRQPWWEAIVIVVLVNCFNVTDVCDGLVAGIAAIAFAGWALTMPASAPVAWTFAAACAGFLILNFPDASIYLGDCGSHVLGAAFAAMICEPMRAASWRLPVSAILIAAIPILETLFLITERTRHGRAWWRGSRDHYSLRLQSAGWSKRQVLAASYAAAALFAAAAFLVRHGEPQLALAAIAALALTTAAAWWRLSSLAPRG